MPPSPSSPSGASKIDPSGVPLPHSLPSSLTAGLTGVNSSKLPCLLSGLGAFKLPLRFLPALRLPLSEITCPALGDAMTTVPGVAMGGVGESDRKSGWICASLPSDAVVYCPRGTGL